ncbi:MAG TPA: hypothetical protein VNH65_07975 [Candidatus Acidoferrum sp.]|nr:hypothetical protein [Candidatus Acidoferrum sp.]
MKLSNITSCMKEEVSVVEQRGGQLEHDLKEFLTNLDGIETLFAEISVRALEYKPQPERQGYYTIDPNIDRADPNEALAFAKERLRRSAEYLTRVSDLVKDARRKIDAIVG